MVSAIVLVVAIVAIVLAVVYVLRSVVGQTFLKYRGKRLVRCPETNDPAAVRVAAAWAAVTAAFDRRQLRLNTCSRWPDRQDCDQPCLLQIRVAPRDTLVATIIRRWYEGKKCVACEKPLEDTDWFHHKPGALSPNGKTVEWRDVTPEKIPAMLATHLPLCWNCVIVQDLRREYPELVVDRPARTSKQH